jgi:hypothetical protein
MNQPTAITVTNYMGKRVNPYQMSNVTPMMGMSNFESFHEYEKNNPEYPCPAIANTEPGETVMAILGWQANIEEERSGRRYWSNIESPEFYNDRLIETRQIWVPIVEQKEGEAHNKELNRLIEMVKSGGYDNEAEIIAVLEKNKK